LSTLFINFFKNLIIIDDIINLGGIMNIESIVGVGPKQAKIFNNLGIYTIDDLLNYYPYKYNFYNISDIRNIADPSKAVIKGIIESVPRVAYIKRNFNRLSFRVNSSNVILNVTIFNRAFLKNNLTVGKEVVLIGKYEKEKNSFVANDIKFNIKDNEIEPVYHLGKGIKNTNIVKAVDYALENIKEVEDYIPGYKNIEYNFIDKVTALKYIHQPLNNMEIKKAKLKLIYEELFIFMFKIMYLKNKNNTSVGIKRNIDINMMEEFIDNLPFTLTDDQRLSLNEIINDLNSQNRMNRLLLGDVGSGKTIVALSGLYANYLSGYQGALMAPTEILGTQHYFNIINLLKNYNITVELLLGSMTKKEKDNIVKRLKTGEIDIVIGTHALLSDNVEFKNLGLVVTDEQHRFGVNQRNTLQNKGVKPDVLYLSATPIPRTYALTIYGDMDVSMIKTKPRGRKEIITKVKKENELKSVLNDIYEELKNGHQIYVVAPLIDEAEEDDLNSVNTLKEKFEMAFPNIARVEILHGKLKGQEKDAIMNDFKNNQIQILVSTTVVEVGVDVKNATMMVIFNAERFGLATLHQLRGRVGRNDLQSYCYLICNQDIERLKVLEESNDGFYISEKDFEFRGEGDLFGTKQSGDMVFKIANLKRDYKILLQAQKDAIEFINKEEYKLYPYYRKIVESVEFLD